MVIGDGLLGGGLLELVAVDGGRVGGAQRLVGHRGPEEPDELAGDRDVRDGRALPVVGEVPVAVMQPDLRLPGALVGLGARSRGGGVRGGSARRPRSAAGGRGCCRSW